MNTTNIIPIEQVAAPGLLEYVENLGPNLVGCELGVCLGFTLRYFFDNAKNISKVYAIDAYKPYMDHWGPVTQEIVDRWRTGSLEVLDPYKSRILWIYADSDQAANLIPNGELDYIFIDGDHSYPAVFRDLRKYYIKVKTGGIFAGHDFDLPSVKSAVEQFREEFGITSKLMFTSNNVWFWYKGI